MEIKRSKNGFIFFIVICCGFVSLYSTAVEISIPSVSVNTGECFAIDVNLYKIEDEDIRTAVIAFAFDPFKIQIGCETNFSSGTYNNPEIYEQETSTGEQPVILSNALVNINIKYRVAIYPQGVVVVVLWGGTDKIPPGLLFTVPCKLTVKAIPGDKLITPLISKEEPIYIQRTFPENQVESQSFYCSLANINALPVDATLVNGTILVKGVNEGDIQEGEGGGFEGVYPEGAKEGEIPEGILEGTIEGQTNEGTISEGIPEGEKFVCGCNRQQEITRRETASLLQILRSSNMNIGFMIALVVILRRL